MQEKENVKKNRPIFAEINTARQFAISFIALLRASKLYPKGHQMLSQMLDAFCAKIGQMTSQEPSVELKIADNTLYAQEVCASAEVTPEIRDFIEHLQNRYVRQIIFRAGATTKDLEKLLGLLAQDTEGIVSAGGAAALLWGGGVKNIKIIEYYYSQHSELNQEKLIKITNSDLFQFFTNESLKLSAGEQEAHFLELLKDARLVAALTTVAARFLLREETTKLPESQIILRILKKIRKTITDLRLFEDDEIRLVCHDILAAYDPGILFDLVFENQGDLFLEYTEALPYLLDLLGTDKATEMIAQKIEDSNLHTKTITNAKFLLGKLFPARQALLDIFPVLKKRLAQHAPEEKVQFVIEELCSILDQGFSIQDGIDLDLGATAEASLTDIAAGLERLKTVAVEKDAIASAINKFPINANYTYILQKLLCTTTAVDDFQKTLNQLTRILLDYLEKDAVKEGAPLLNFLLAQIGPGSCLAPELKQRALEIKNSFSSLAIEKMVIHALFEQNAENARVLLEQFYVLLAEHLTSALIKIYVREEEFPHRQLLQQMIIDKLNQGFLKKLDVDLQHETPVSVSRFIELFQNVDTDNTLPFLWDITLHENVRLAQRALRLIANKSSGPALALLIKALEHASLPIRMSAIEYAAEHSHKKILEKLNQIARQGIGANDEYVNTECRILAIKSLSALAPQTAAQILQEVLGKKKMLFVPIEPKKLYQFAKEQLKVLNKTGEN
ncbi:MAG: hypothetical protein KKF93_05550 [Candidatus Omnitrophica bacterium]|nr:hypothetical protein [Candidatus Omnitrophota bacterium]